MTTQNTQTCIEHGTLLDSYYVAAEPHPMGGIVPAHEGLSCSDCQLEDMSPEDFRDIEPTSNLSVDIKQPYLTQANAINTIERALAKKTAPKIKQYAVGVIGSRFVSTKTRGMGYAVSVLDHHYLADHYGSLPIVRESEIEDLLGYHGGELTEAQEVIEFGFIADDWAEIDILKNKEVSKEAGIRFDTNK
jgi:hypothetical protein